MRPRHTDQDLLDLALEGSASAFASLLHRHRDVIQRAALRADRPEQTASATLVAAMRALRHGEVRADDLRGWLSDLGEVEVRRAPGSPGVERMLPGDWFDRAWVEVQHRWPTGRRPLHVPRWAGLTAGALALATAGSVTSYLVLTSDVTTEVISELIAEPIEDPDVLVVPGPVVEPGPEVAPELFGDVELGELPAYDLTGGGDTAPERPTIGPPAAPDPTAEDGARDDAADGTTD